MTVNLKSVTVAITALALASGTALAQDAGWVGTASYKSGSGSVSAGFRMNDSMLRLDERDVRSGKSFVVLLDFQAQTTTRFPTGPLAADQKLAVTRSGVSFPRVDQYSSEIGIKSVAGQSCNLFSVLTQTAYGSLEEYSVCETAEGAILLVTEQNGDTLFEVSSIRAQTQPPFVFQVPADYQIVEANTELAVTSEDEDRSALDEAKDRMKDSTMDEVENRVDRERSEVVDKVLGSIFGN